MGNDGRGLVGAGRGNAFNVPRHNESGRILVSSCEVEFSGAFSVDSAATEESAEGARAPEHFGSTSLTAASIRPLDDFFASPEASGTLSEGPVRELDAGDAGETVVFSIV